MREKKIERTMLENGEEMIVFNLFCFFIIKIIIPTKIDRDSERERERAREGKEQTIDGQRQIQR